MNHRMLNVRKSGEVNYRSHSVHGIWSSVLLLTYQLLPFSVIRVRARLPSAIAVHTKLFKNDGNVNLYKNEALD